MAGFARSPRRPGSARPRCAGVCRAGGRRGPVAGRAGTPRPVVDASRRRARSGAGRGAAAGWWSPTSAAIRCRRCGGRRSRCGTWPRSCPGRAIRSRRRRWAGCCGTTGSACRARRRRWRASQHPDRDAQFRYINEQVKAHQDAGQPVISVDAKKKEQLGQLPAAGREWRPKGDPVPVEDHSFFTAGPGRAAGRPLRHLRPHRRHRLGQRRSRPRHLRVRRRLDPTLVAGARRRRLSGCATGC